MQELGVSIVHSVCNDAALRLCSHELCDVTAQSGP